LESQRYQRFLDHLPKLRFPKALNVVDIIFSSYAQLRDGVNRGVTWWFDEVMWYLHNEAPG
jgi:hypothetical protein